MNRSPSTCKYFLAEYEAQRVCCGGKKSHRKLVSCLRYGSIMYDACVQRCQQHENRRNDKTVLDMGLPGM